jgi:hypothetical protein
MPDRSRSFDWLMVTSLILFAPLAGLKSPARALADGSCVVKITRFEWVPQRVHPGGRTRLWLTAWNCTRQTVELTVTEFGEQIPPCPVIDPIGSQVVLDPMGRYAPPPFRMVAPACDGVETMVVQFTDSQGTLLAKRTATVRIAPFRGASCTPWLSARVRPRIAPTRREPAIT